MATLPIGITPITTTQPVPTGITWQVLPAAVGFGILAERAPDSGGSPGTWATVASFAPAKVPPEGVLFTDYLPADGQYYWYRFSHWAAGYVTGATSTPVKAKAVAIDPSSQGLGAQAAALTKGGLLQQTTTPATLTKKLRVGPADFVITDDSAAGGYLMSAVGDLTARVAGIQSVFYAPVHLPVGAVITTVTFKGRRSNAADGCTVKMYATTDVFVAATLVNVSLAAAAGYQTSVTSGIGHTVLDTNTYALEARLNGNAAAVDAGLGWVEIAYTLNDYTTNV